MSALARLPLAALLAGSALLAGCGGGDDKGSLGDVRANGTDAAFVLAAIPHHEDAVDAADLALSGAKHRPLKRLAEGILQTQSVELATLRTVRDVLQEASVEPGDLGLSEAETGGRSDPAVLRKASDFDCAFLEQMIPNHEVAIRIARAELDAGIHAELRRMSENTVDQQGHDARQMRRFQRAWC